MRQPFFISVVIKFSMNLFFTILAVIFVLLTLVVCVAGVVLMSRGGEKNEKYGKKLMSLRVFMQFLAVFSLVLSFVF